jgi:TIR domain
MNAKSVGSIDAPFMNVMCHSILPSDRILWSESTNKVVAMPIQIFISYRRDGGLADNIVALLRLELGNDVLLTEPHALSHGESFDEALRQNIVRSDVFLALIGPNWLGLRKEDGTRRLDNPDDPVRIEIATALRRDIRVIPILLDGARMPTAEELPDDLKPLARRQWLQVRSTSFGADMNMLIRGISERRLGSSAEPPGAAPSMAEQKAAPSEGRNSRVSPMRDDLSHGVERQEVRRTALEPPDMAKMREHAYPHPSDTDDVSDLIDFSVFAPPTASVGTEIFVQVMLHVASDLAAARQRAAEIDDSAALRGTSTLQIPIPDGSRVTVMLAFDGADVAIDRPVQTMRWSRQLVAVNFLVKTPSVPRTIFPVVRVGRDGAIAGEMRFKLDVVARSTTNTVGILQDPECKRYQRVFFSYSSQDRRRVLEVAQSYRVLGVSFFNDILSLEPGQRWQQGLYKEIDICDLFLLFWSYASSRSEWVAKEAQYAVAQRKKSGDLRPDIVPLILDGPPPPAVPDFLSHLHFDDWMRYAISATKARHSFARTVWWLIFFGIVLVAVYIYLTRGVW